MARPKPMTDFNWVRALPNTTPESVVEFPTLLLHRSSKS